MSNGILAVIHGDERFDLACGDAREILGDLRTAKVTKWVNSVETSPPYFGLRDNKVPALEWGARPGCHHEWRPGIVKGITGGTASPKVHIKGEDNFQIVPDAEYEACIRCDGWRGQLGREPTVRMYVAHLMEIFDEIAEALHPSGSVWLNLGDSYAGSGKGPSGYNGFGGQEKRQGFVGSGPRLLDLEYKPKDMMLVPYRVVRALQKRGWYVRSVAPWIKPNAMAQSVLDRMNFAHEWVFHLTRERTYYYDADAVLRPALTESHRGKVRNWRTTDPWYDSLDALIEDQQQFLEYLYDLRRTQGALLDERGLMRAFVAKTSQYKDGHFSTFSRWLVEPMILATTPQKVCATCFTPLVHDRRNCRHFSANTLPGMNLDPFCGVGTACGVALNHGFRAVGIDLNEGYVALARRDLRGALTTY